MGTNVGPWDSFVLCAVCEHESQEGHAQWAGECGGGRLIKGENCNYPSRF